MSLQGFLRKGSLPTQSLKSRRHCVPNILPRCAAHSEVRNKTEKTMENSRKCTVCKKLFDGSEASILTMSGFGNARLICPECAELLDTATLDTDYEKIKAAMDSLADRNDIDPADSAAVSAFTNLLDTAAERAEKIKSGEYDFSLDTDSSEDEFEEIPEELKESEEDRALDEKEAKASAIMDKISTWVCGAIIVGAIVYVILRFLL